MEYANSQQLHVWPEVPREEKGQLTLSARLEGFGDPPQKLWFRLSSEHRELITDSSDPFVIGTLFHAMRHGLDLHVHGCVSPSLLRNLEEFQAAWACWRPDHLRRIAIVADREAEEYSCGSERTVITFSGGLDSCYSVWKHTIGPPHRRRQPLHSALMVHGFDIPLEETEVFERAVEKARCILESVNLDLIPLACNFRQLVEDWEQTHGAALAACLHLLRRGFSRGMIASSHVYNHLRFPWGSNPLTDPILSSQGFPILHDGTDLHRLEKAAAIRHWNTAMEHLRVCWAGQQKDRNCGRCTKCVSTAICFTLEGGPVPPALGIISLPRAINGLKQIYIPPVSVKRLEELRDRALHLGIREPWVASLKQCIRYHKRAGFFRILKKWLISLRIGIPARTQSKLNLINIGLRDYKRQRSQAQQGQDRLLADQARSSRS